jgi:hypothetical protein
MFVNKIVSVVITWTMPMAQMLLDITMVAVSLGKNVVKQYMNYGGIAILPRQAYLHECGHVIKRINGLVTAADSLH